MKCPVPIVHINQVQMNCISFGLDDLFIDVSGLLKSPHYYCVTVNFPFSDVSIGLMHWVVPILSAYILIIIFISSSWIDTLIIVYCLFLVSCNSLVLKSIVSDMCVAAPAFFLISNAWDIFFQPPHLQSVCIPRPGVHLL